MGKEPPSCARGHPDARLDDSEEKDGLNQTATSAASLDPKRVGRCSILELLSGHKFTSHESPTSRNANTGRYREFSMVLSSTCTEQLTAEGTRPFPHGSA
ncbi:hypothetical protein PDE_09435 [Penicillium oxalicum 114-2]|uniref:Uncharacterized protein n=1 Tax=Penicillium oxalicum (strain 114-2 / CGMCC 5302) TaxID=933388 RepID=S8A046_PENO1|nr:hypothetical protein PDE_09435 [Penicillium oxalicum 114-2]